MLLIRCDKGQLSLVIDMSTAMGMSLADLVLSTFAWSNLSNHPALEYVTKIVNGEAELEDGESYVIIED